MGNDPILYTAAKRKRFCRGCDKVIPVGTKSIDTFSYRNRGQYIFFCDDCVDIITRLKSDG